MDINKIDPSALEFTSEELDALAQVLAKAELIKKDTTLLRLVQKHSEKKIKQFKSIEDLKKHSKNLDEEDRKKEADKKKKQMEDSGTQKPDEDDEMMEESAQ